MRDYLYVWHDPERQAIIASGIELKDMLHCLSGQGGLVLLDHQSDIAEHDRESGFYYVERAGFNDLETENIYSWGNCIWSDFAPSALPKITEMDIAELLFFAHKGRPLREVSIGSLGNRFLAYAHDDGWYLRLYYSNWKFVEELIARSVPASLGFLSAAAVKSGVCGFWLSGGTVSQEEKTENIDLVLNRNL